jgi:hypothetical protein
MAQRFEVWQPEPGREVRVSLEALIDDWEGFRLLLRDEATDRVIRLSFPAHVAYRNRDESDLDGEAARSSGLGKGCFYRVIDSEFLNRFREESARRFDQLFHFAVITDADCVDVLATGEPRLERL